MDDCGSSKRRWGPGFTISERTYTFELLNLHNTAQHSFHIRTKDQRTLEKDGRESALSPFGEVSTFQRPQCGIKISTKPLSIGQK